MRRLDFSIADHSDFDSIHRLNYRTFVDEIPQHAPNESHRLIDRFHSENTYFVCHAENRVVGMVCGRCVRPFSLDQKIQDLDRWLPAHHKLIEVRLLSVEPAYRKTAVFLGLVTAFSRHYISRGFDLAVISGTVRELKLYSHLGFESFAELVGTTDASYQPMYLTLDAFTRQVSILHGAALLS
jgi:predicted N-acetyltransferase YhbS